MHVLIRISSFENRLSKTKQLVFHWDRKTKFKFKRSGKFNKDLTYNSAILNKLPTSNR